MRDYRYMTIVYDMEPNARPAAGFHETLLRAQQTIDYGTDEHKPVELYERIGGSYVKIAEYGVSSADV